MLWTAILPRIALLLVLVPSLAGAPALAGCGGKGWGWEEPDYNRYCPAPGENGFRRRNDSLPPLSELLPFAKDKRRPRYYVQMYSCQSRGDALQVGEQMAARFRSTLGCCELELRRIDLGLLGPYWSIWAGPVRDKTLAVELCQSLRLDGLRSCVIDPQ